MEGPLPGDLLIPSLTWGTVQTSHSALSYLAIPLTEFRGFRKEGGGEGSSLWSPLSFCSDRVVPTADSSELKHENTQDPQPVFFISSFFRGRGEEGSNCPRLHGTHNVHTGKSQAAEISSKVEGTR